MRRQRVHVQASSIENGDVPEQWRDAFGRAAFGNVRIAPDIEKIRELYPHFFTGAICGQK